MKKLVRAFKLSCLVLIGSSSVAINAAEVDYEDNGHLTEVIAKERKVVISEKTYRVALSARLIGMDGKKMALEDIEAGPAIYFETDKETKDVTDMRIIAYP